MGEDTHGICVAFTQRKVGQFHSEKEAKRCGSPRKIKVMYEVKKEQFLWLKKEHCVTVTQN